MFLSRFRRAPRSFNLLVLRRYNLSEDIERVTLGGADLVSFPQYDDGHRCSLLLTWPEQETWRSLMPTVTGAWTGAAQFGFLAAALLPPRCRVTIREFRPTLLEMDFDVFLHDHSALAFWASHISPGTRVKILA